MCLRDRAQGSWRTNSCLLQLHVPRPIVDLYLPETVMAQYVQILEIACVRANSISYDYLGVLFSGVLPSSSENIYRSRAKHSSIVVSS